jgi:hypothetical protein
MAIRQAPEIPARILRKVSLAQPSVGAMGDALIDR